MHRMPRRQRGPLPMRHLAQRALLVTAAPALALPSPTAYCDLDRGQILPRRSDTPAEGVHAQIEVFLWGLKKAEAISIACARGLYVGRPDDPTVGMTSENAWTGGKIPPDLTCTSCTGPRTGPLPPRR